jgi:hypothetical protein
VFFCSKQRLSNAVQHSFKSLDIREVESDQPHIIAGERGWKLLSPSQRVEVGIISQEEGFQLTVHVESKVPALNFAVSDYLEEELLYRIKEKVTASN